MITPYKLAAVLLISIWICRDATAHEMLALKDEILAINTQISEVEAIVSSSEDRLIRIFAQSRREALLLLRSVLEARQIADEEGAAIEVTIPSVNPDPDRAELLVRELALQEKRIEDAAFEAASARYLTTRAWALQRVELEKLSLTLLQMAYLQARYGIAFPVASQAVALTMPSLNISSQAATAEVDEEREVMPWADPDYPNIDYSLSTFEAANYNGNQISGWWVIFEDRAKIDDSSSVAAINYSAYDERSHSGSSMLLAQCKEGETSIVFLQDEFLIAGRREPYKIEYRIDDETSQITRWNHTTNFKGAGIWGQTSEDFLKELYGAKQFYLRLTDARGQRVDATFDLGGIEEVIDAVAGACEWSTIDLAHEEFLAIQSKLNAIGFDAGTPDGIWGNSSREALRAYQEENGIKPTGEPDRETLEALDIQRSD